jgi:hypothetical protein
MEVRKLRQKQNEQNQQFFGPLIVGNPGKISFSFKGTNVDISSAKWAHSIVISRSVEKSMILVAGCTP